MVRPHTDTRRPPLCQLARAWDRYRRHVIHADAGADQILQLQQAFYAGATVVVMITRQIGEPNCPESLGVEMMKQLNREVRQFEREIAEGQEVK